MNQDDDGDQQQQDDGGERTPKRTVTEPKIVKKKGTAKKLHSTETKATNTHNDDQDQDRGTYDTSYDDNIRPEGDLEQDAIREEDDADGDEDQDKECEAVGYHQAGIVHPVLLRLTRLVT
jgi:hypothetical protein